METTRQRIADALREGPRTASDLAATLSLPRPTIYEHLEHVSRSVADAGGADADGDGDEEFLVAPPTCRECGFDGFDDPVNEPSRCPECRCERIEEPAFVIR
ncbi:MULTISPECIES: transcriptional regulator [Halorubrum]|uniref:Putative transcriptional regulator containing an HTH domain fused to a Zn-ribbon n=1 Tax=Halorubrum hochstenium ATCC 700873 TaxID=1227481 RepID=M0EXU1_9EURY|nr:MULTISPECIES: helix-turn-helix domain-containing protein [Halorubrum]ELZ52616.1 putative transcriptional regulator containing an HTH domain fused to a Zn-ribbon [Halorubrum hochstenium ATCC 700873]